MAINVQDIINKTPGAVSGNQSTMPKGKINQSLYGVSPLTQSTLEAKQGSVLPQMQTLLDKKANLENQLKLLTSKSGKGKQSELPETKDKKKKKTPQTTIKGTSSPTVMSNANKIERVIPLLDSQARNLSFNLSSNDSGSNIGSNTNFNNTGSGGDSFGNDTNEQSFDEILGFTGDKKKKKKEEEELDPETKQQMALLEQMQKNADSQARQALNRIQNQYNLREQEQRALTASGVNSIKSVLNMAGSSRYAPISSQGIISAAESAGIKALSALDAEEQQLIGEVKAAQASNDYQLLEKKLKVLDEVKRAKSEATATLQADMQATEEQSRIDNLIATEIASGNADPIAIFQAIRAQGDNVPLSTITNALTNLNSLSGKSGIGGTGFKLENKSIGQLLGSGWTAPDIQALQADLNSGASLDDVLAGVDPEMQEVVKEAFGLKPGTNVNVRPGLGAKTGTEEAFIRTRLFAKIAPILNKGTLSDADRAIIDSRIAEFRDAGLGEQEILDTLAGIPPEVNSPYNGTFRDLIVSNSETMEKQTTNMGRLSQQLSSGNYQQAMNTVENLALTEAKKLDPDGYMGTATAQSYLKKSQELNKLLAKPEIQELTGPISGTFENLKGKFRSKEAQELRSKITSLVAEMRKDLSGSAVTESESRFLEPLIPSLTDSWENLSTKNKTLGENALSKYNSTRSVVSLPTVTAEEVIDPRKRLILYSNDIYLPANGTLDI